MVFTGSLDCKHIISAPVQLFQLASHACTANCPLCKTSPWELLGKVTCHIYLYFVFLILLHFVFWGCISCPALKTLILGSKSDTSQRCVFWDNLLLELYFLKYSTVKLDWRVVLVIHMFMGCQGISGPESFLALFAGDGVPCQVISFNVFPQIAYSFLLPTRCASVQYIAAGAFPRSLCHHWV